MAPSEDEIASGYHDGLSSFAEMLDTIVAIAFCCANGAPWAVVGHTNPGFKIFRISERMEQAAYVRMNAGLGTNRKSVGIESHPESFAHRLVTSWERKCVKPDLLLHTRPRCNQGSTSLNAKRICDEDAITLRSAHDL